MSSCVGILKNDLFQIEMVSGDLSCTGACGGLQKGYVEAGGEGGAVWREWNSINFIPYLYLSVEPSVHRSPYLYRCQHTFLVIYLLIYSPN